MGGKLSKKVNSIRPRELLDEDDDPKTQASINKARLRWIVLNHLSAMADDDTGICWTSRRHLEEFVDATQPTIKRILRWLEEGEVLTRVAQFDTTGRSLSNIYVMHRLLNRPIDTEEAIALYKEQMLSREYGPNLLDSSDDAAVEEEPEVVIRDDYAWWQEAAALLVKGKPHLLNMGLDDMLNMAAAGHPPKWLKKWMLELDGHEETNVFAASPKFRLYWLAYLYNRHHGLTKPADFSTKKGMMRELLSFSRLGLIQGGDGQVDIVLATRAVMLSVIKNYRGLPQSGWSTKVSDLPKLWTPDGGESTPAEREAADRQAESAYLSGPAPEYRISEAQQEAMRAAIERGLEAARKAEVGNVQ